MTSLLMWVSLASALLWLPLVSARAGAQNRVWYFAVSGDSRNCGDVIMPAIARGVRQDGAAFYWHLGDYRAIYDFDQDFRERNPQATISTYESRAWQDFIDHQLNPFGDLPVYLALGNHETISPKTRTEAIQQFADWLNAPENQKQRLADDPKDHLLKAYYHRIDRGVDFTALDNASEEQFDSGQIEWFAAVIKRAAENPTVRTVVVGMHKALPDSLSTGHSMNESAEGTQSGRIVYQQLVEFQKRSHKNVYVLASHSHFLMENVYNTRCRSRHPESILPGWIVGTAARYAIACLRTWRGLARPRPTCTAIFSGLSRRTVLFASRSAKCDRATFPQRTYRVTPPSSSKAAFGEMLQAMYLTGLPSHPTAHEARISDNFGEAQGRSPQTPTLPMTRAVCFLLIRCRDNN